MAINSYWRPGDYDWTVNPDWGPGAPLHDNMANETAQGMRDYFGNWLGHQGYLGNDVQSDFARSLLNKFEQGYHASRFDDPMLKWTDYLEDRKGTIGDMAAATDPQSRGVNRRQYSGNARWLQRGW